MAFYVNYPAFLSPFVIPGKTFLRWYSMMYIFAFATCYLLFRHQLRHNQSNLKVSLAKGEDMDLFVTVILALIIGARVGSCLIYSGSYYWKRPWLMFWPFQGGRFVGLPGMSYHGGVVGVCMGIWLYARRHGLKFLDIADPILAGTPFAYTFGRLGNFFNAELYGKVAKSGHGMIFPDAEPFWTGHEWVKAICEKAGIDPGASSLVNLPRHPSQLYEALFEGIVLGAIMWFYVRPMIKKRKRGIAAGAYLFLYGFFRFIIEYFRQPDENMGYILKLGAGSDNIYVFTSILNFSTGQILCAVMMAFGLTLILHKRKD